MQKNIPYNDTLALGKGFDSVKGSSLGSIFLPDFELYETLGAEGQVTTFKLVRIDESEQIYKELGISIDIAGRYGLFSGENNFQFSQSSSFNSFSVFYLLSVKVTNAVKRIKRYALDPLAVEMLKNGETDRFKRAYGDSYIEAISTGGEFFALYEFYCQDEATKTDISNRLQAQYGSSLISGVEVDASFKLELANSSRKSQLKLTVFQTGGVGERIPDNPAELLERAKNFPSVVKENKGVMFSAIFQSYETLPLPKGPNYVALENKKYVLDSYAKDIMKWRETLNDLDYIIDRPEEFEFDVTDVEKGKAQMQIVVDQRLAVSNIIKDFTAHAIKCADTIAECAPFNPKQEDLEKVNKLQLPARKKTLDFVIIYDDVNYKGNAQYLEKGKFKDGLKDLGLKNDTIRSVKIPAGWQVILFEDSYFNGRKLPLQESCPDLAVQNFSAITSSVFVGNAGETCASETIPSSTPSGSSGQGSLKYLTKFNLVRSQAFTIRGLR